MMEGLMVGHAEDREGLTGCTVVLLPPGCKGGGEVRGGAPGTRETDLLNPVNLVEEVNAFMVAGGSAFGLAAAEGVARYLEEREIGFDAGVAKVPIIPAAVIFDLGAGDAAARPDAMMGYRACEDASGDIERQGNVGAGMGATVGLIYGSASCSKGGLGTASFEGGGGLEVFALAVVNAFGDVVDERGRIIAGARGSDGGFLDTCCMMEDTLKDGLWGEPMTNTTIGVIVANAALTKTEVNWVARVGHNGLARAISPCHTKFDGDTVFAASSGEVEVTADLVAVIGARLLAQAVRNAVINAESVAGIPAHRDLV